MTRDVDAQIELISERMTKLESTIYGNGKEGLLTKFARIEQRLDLLPELKSDLKSLKEDANFNVTRWLKDNLLVIAVLLWLAAQQAGIF